ncbi:HAMP domain-containing histidine kinase [Luteolibacter flavescens]|uniref:histidine kinase n=1 Tax=Luteolibacter flavescens TaxID=1859460 RepID=A0ABT3FI15_9BACT|nr:HAMP domain-containing histidine kinase [Luteolibacter flavescens]MCW1883197.1 HAMP domain-containing histidine kinase [Luteolibacter flavescens]
MKRPSIRRRLMLGCVLIVSAVLGWSKLTIYHEVERSLREQLDEQLMRSAILLSKSAELEAGGIVYEWQEALESSGGLGLDGLFQFWDERTSATTRSPDLGGHDLPYFHGALDEPVFRDVVLADGESGRALGLRHYPFTNHYGRAEMERRGEILRIEDYPQVVVCARETAGLDAELKATRHRLAKSGLLTLVAICVGIYLIIRWTLAPIDRLVANLVKRSTEVGTPLPEIPDDLPVEVIGLATAFNSTLERVELARAHEKEFAFSAAHQLRTPISGIHAILEVAHSKPKDGEDLHRRIGSALAVTREIRVTINSLMSLARLRGGIDEMPALPYEPGPIVRSVLEAATSQPDHGLHLEVSYPAEKIVLNGDGGMFQIIVQNMVENAFRYTPRGGRILVSLGMQESCFTLKVANSRGDLEAGDAERIFRPFERGRRVSVNAPGAGLGLPLAREIAYRLGGTLELEVGDKLATFTFRVKAQIASHS